MPVGRVGYEQVSFSGEGQASLWSRANKECGDEPITGAIDRSVSAARRSNAGGYSIVPKANSTMVWYG